MEDKELEELLKMNFPEIRGDEEKVLLACKKRKNKYNKILKSSIYVLSSFVVIASIIIMSILLINNRIPSDVEKINDAILSLDNIENDEEKMLEIMKIDKEIQTIDNDKLQNINNTKLLYEKNLTVNNLKNSVEWSELFVIDEQYFIVESIVDLSNVSVAKINENSLNPNEAYEERINDLDFNKSFLSLINVPYSEISLENDNVLINMFRKEMKSYDYRSPFYVMYDINEDSFFQFMIHPSGYIVITIQKLLEDKITLYKKYVSIVRVNYEDFELLLDKENLKKYNMYKNYNIVKNEMNIGKTDISSIDFLSIIENASSSIAKIINDKDDIELILSFINNDNMLFDKEIYYVKPYDFSCITIGISLKLSDGSTNNISCKISNEGVLKVRASNDPYIYYTDKNVIDYNALLACIRNILYK